MALQFEDIKKAQQGKTRDELATIAQQSTAPPLRINPEVPIPSEDLGKTIKAPPVLGSTDTNAFVGGISDSQKYFQDLINQQTASLEAKQTQQDTLEETLKKGFADLEGKSAAVQAEQQKLGLPQQYEDLSNLNLQIADLTGAFNKQITGKETKGIQEGTPALFFQGEQAALRRQKAAEIGALSVRQAALAGNIDLANQRVDKTIELQFQPIENKIKQTLTFLDLNRADMTSAERRKADSIKTALKLQATQLKQQKEDRSNALIADIRSKFFKYPGSDQVYNTTNGEPLSFEEYKARGGKDDFSNITEFNPIETQQVLSLAKKYPDAGIRPSDTLNEATAKLGNSAKYRKQTRVTGGKGGVAKVTEKDSAILANQYLKQEAGTDGYISPETWATALDAWVSDGHTISSFINRFRQFVNPADPQDYIEFPK